MMTVDVAPVLREITNLLLETLRSTDPRRFAIVHHVNRTATRFIQATSVRAEDFEDKDTLERKRPPLFFRDGDTAPRVLVPEELAPTSTAVLVAMTEAITIQLQTERSHRFKEAERLAECALSFIATVMPATKVESKGATTVIACDDPEGDYIREGQTHAPRDTNQLRREILEIEGTDSQIRAELALAKIATEEAAELSHLLSAQKGGSDHDLYGPVADRIALLRAKIAFRSKGENGLVSANVSRGHQPRGEGARKDHSPGDAHAAQGEAGTRRVA